MIRDDWLPDVASAAVADTPVFTSAGDGGDDAARGAADSPVHPPSPSRQTPWYVNNLKRYKNGWVLRYGKPLKM